MSEKEEGKTYGVVEGCLQEILLGKNQQRSHLVQVLAVQGPRITISDGLHVLTNCIVARNITEITKALVNGVIKVIEWSLIRLVMKDDLGKPEFGILLSKFEIIKTDMKLARIGKPKMMRLDVLHENESDESLKKLVAEFFEDIKTMDGENTEECKMIWAEKILNILKRSDRSWMCVVCRHKLSDILEVKVISHVQAHLKYFPGYLCSCKLHYESLLEYKEHLHSDEHKDAMETHRSDSEEALSKLLNSVDTHLLAKMQTIEPKREDMTMKEDKKEDISKVAEELANFMADDLLPYISCPKTNLGDETSWIRNDPSVSEIVTVEEDAVEKDNKLKTNKRKSEDILIDYEKNSKSEKYEAEFEQTIWYREVSKMVDVRGNNFYCREPSCFSTKPYGNRSILKHIEKHHLKRVTSFQCGECGKHCDSLIHHQDHVRSKHKKYLTLETFGAR